MKIYVIIGIMTALMLTMTASSTVDRFGYVHNVVLGFSTLEDLDHYYKLEYGNGNATITGKDIEAANAFADSARKFGLAFAFINGTMVRISQRQEDHGIAGARNNEDPYAVQATGLESWGQTEEYWIPEVYVTYTSN